MLSAPGIVPIMLSLVVGILYDLCTNFADKVYDAGALPALLSVVRENRSDRATEIAMGALHNMIRRDNADEYVRAGAVTRCNEILQRSPSKIADATIGFLFYLSNNTSENSVLEETGIVSTLARLYDILSSESRERMRMIIFDGVSFRGVLSKVVDAFLDNGWKRVLVESLASDEKVPLVAALEALTSLSGRKEIASDPVVVGALVETLRNDDVDVGALVETLRNDDVDVVESATRAFALILRKLDVDKYEGLVEDAVVHVVALLASECPSAVVIHAIYILMELLKHGVFHVKIAQEVKKVSDDVILKSGSEILQQKYVYWFHALSSLIQTLPRATRKIFDERGIVAALQQVLRSDPVAVDDDPLLLHVTAVMALLKLEVQTSVFSKDPWTVPTLISSMHKKIDEDKIMTTLRTLDFDMESLKTAYDRLTRCSLIFRDSTLTDAWCWIIQNVGRLPDVAVDDGDESRNLCCNSKCRKADSKFRIQTVGRSCFCCELCARAVWSSKVA